MKKLIAILTLALFAMPVFAQPDGGERCNCPPPVKVHKEPFKCKKGLEKVQCGKVHRCVAPPAPKPVVAEPVAPAPAPVVVVAPPAPAPEPLPQVIEKVPDYVPPPPSKWHYGPYLELGTSFVNPKNVLNAKSGGTWTMLEGNLGFHAHYLPWHLGGRAYMSGYGPGLELQGYILQGDKFEWFAFAGTRYVGGPFKYPSVIDVYRRWDLTWGTGVEYALTPHWVLLGDVRVSTALYRQEEQNYQFENWNTFTNELAQLRLLLGVMYRF